MSGVVISGSGCVTCAGLSPSALYSAAINNEHGLSVDSDTGLTLGLIAENHTQSLEVNSAFASYTEGARKKPYRYLYASLSQAMSAAGWDHIPADTGIIFATTTGFVPYWEKDLVSFTNDKLDGHSFRDSFRDHPLNRPLDPLRAHYELRGPVRIVTSACAAGTQSLVLAYHWIKRGYVKRCIVAGTELLSTLTVRGFNSLNLISKDPCAPFDQHRSGINLSEGAGVLLVEREDLAKATVAILSGGGTSLDSYDMTSPDPSGDGIVRAVRGAFRTSELNPREIDWVHAHGTGSQANDLAEAAAMHRVFGDSAPPLTSTKGLHGHALAVSGIIESALCIEAMKHQMILGTTNHKMRDEKIVVPVQKDHMHASVRHILKTTLGFGGVNAAVILSKPEAKN